jgi:5'(3')-deoxyribonucleotidase
MPKPVTRETIAVDVDDVLAEHIEAFIAFSNKNHDTNFALEDYLEQWSKLWGIPRSEVAERAINFQTPETLGDFGVIEDAQRVLTNLKQTRDLVVVTARPKRTIESTKKWIDRNFPNTFSSINFVPIWDPGPKVTKAEICKKIGADYLIDDIIRHCNLAVETGIKAILFARIGWNQPDEPHPGIVQVKNWQEVLEYFDAKS